MVVPGNHQELLPAAAAVQSGLIIVISVPVPAVTVSGFAKRQRGLVSQLALRCSYSLFFELRRVVLIKKRKIIITTAVT